MTDKFEHAIEFLLEHEGGFSDHKNDAGGVTKFGISLRFLKLADDDINGDGEVSEADIVGITKAQAISIYKKHWWDKYKYDDILDFDLATKVFDSAVNTGPTRAHKHLQIAINRLSDEPIAVDGLIGPQTLKRANDLMEESTDLICEFRECLAHFYRNLVADNPQYSVFRDGWLQRAYN